MKMGWARAISTWILITFACGCGAPRPANPSFDVSFSEARQAMRQMREQPTPLQRPLVIVEGRVSGTLYAANTAGAAIG